MQDNPAQTCHSWKIEKRAVAYAAEPGPIGGCEGTCT